MDRSRRACAGDAPIGRSNGRAWNCRRTPSDPDAANGRRGSPTGRAEPDAPTGRATPRGPPRRARSASDPSNPPRPMHLAIRDLSKTYPNGTRALKDVSLDMPQGMFGLLGRNGAGKSTLMRIIATLQDADEGSVRLGDIDVLRQKGEVRKTLGYLPQSFGFHPKATAETAARSLRGAEGDRGARGAARCRRVAASADEPVGGARAEARARSRAACGSASAWRSRCWATRS